MESIYPAHFIIDNEHDIAITGTVPFSTLYRSVVLNLRSLAEMDLLVPVRYLIMTVSYAHYYSLITQEPQH